MKILHVGKYYSPYKGGIETMVQSLAEGCVQQGHEVTVLCSSESCRRSEEVINGVKVIRVPRFGTLLSQPLTPTLPFEFKRLASQHDLVHFHSPNPLAEISLLTFGSPKPLFVTYHADIVRQKLLIPFYRRLLAAFLKKMQRIFVSSPHLPKSSFILPEFSTKCEVIPFGLDPKDFQVTDHQRQIAENFQLRHGPYFVFVGRLVSYKGVSILLSAMKHVKAKALIVGEGPLKNDLLAQTISNRLQDKVVFLGPLREREELLGCIRGSQALVLPSITSAEAFGLVLIEAMACEKPVVASRLPTGVSYVVADGESGYLFETGNSEDLANTLNRLVPDKELATKLGRSARKRFETVFSQNPMVLKHLEFYKTLNQ